MRVSVIGSAMVDTFLEYPCSSQLILHTNNSQQKFQLLQEGVKIELSSIHTSLGGGACNTAASFSRLGYDATIIAATGKDHAHEYIMHQLQCNAINTSTIAHYAQEPSGTSFIIPCAKGDRIALIYRGANNLLTLKHALRGLNQSDVVYCASLHTELAQNIAALIAHAQTNTAIVACNPGSSQLTQYASYLCDALKGLTILIVNAYEAALLAHALNIQDTTFKQQSEDSLPLLLSHPLRSGEYTASLPAYMRTLHARGVAILVVTNGAEGVYVSNDKQILFQASNDTNIVSTLGAGDAFGSCFTALWAQNKPLDVCTRLAVCNSISVLQHLDTQTGLLTQQELQLQEPSLVPLQHFIL